MLGWYSTLISSTLGDACEVGREREGEGDDKGGGGGGRVGEDGRGGVVVGSGLAKNSIFWAQLVLRLLADITTYLVVTLCLAWQLLAHLEHQQLAAHPVHRRLAARLMHRRMVWGVLYVQVISAHVFDIILPT